MACAAILLVMARRYVLARPDGTDLRTGTVALRLGATVSAPAHAPLRLAGSPIELVTLGARDASASLTPWRVFEVEDLRSDWDHNSAMEGHAYLLGEQVEVVREVPLPAILGCEPAARARALATDLLPRCVPGAESRPDENRLATLVAEFLARYTRNGLNPPIEELRALPIRCTGTEPSRPWPNKCCEEQLTNEARMAAEDAELLATCDGSGAVQHYIAEAKAVSARFANWARPHYESWSRDFRDDPLIHYVGPHVIVEAYVMWELVEPLLAAPPTSLVNLFEPLAEMAIGGAFLVGWNESECVLYQVP